MRTGRPAPEQLAWTPTLDAGSYTGQTQAAWTVTGNSQYVVLGGEFPRVNYTDQQGLVRFAVKSLAPNKQGPTTPGEPVPTGSSDPASPGALRLNWTASWDRDSRRLKYDVLRDGVVIGSVQADSSWWNRPTVTYVDTTYTPGTTASYQIRSSDSNGTTITGDAVNLTAPATTRPSGAYADLVRADGARNYWRLGETSGSVAYDWTGGKDLALSSVSRNTAGAVANTPDAATTFATGTTGTRGRTTVSQYAPQTFSAEAWFKTSSTQGGKIVGFGNSTTGDSGTADRQVYLTSNGRLVFGVQQSSTDARTLTTTATYNNNQWHHVVATLGDGGMTLYVDGAAVGSRTDTTFGQLYSGYWRVGGDAITSIYPDRPTRSRLAADIDDVAIYPAALTATQVLKHNQVGRGLNQAPVAAFSSAANELAAAFDGSASADADGTLAGYAWDYGDGASGTGVTSSHTYAAAGTYTVTLTVTDNAGATNAITKPVTVVFNAPPVASFTSSASDLTGSFNASASSDPDGTIAGYAWNFGDGTTGTGATSTHAYTAGGTYTVTLTVSDNGGKTGSNTGTITVTPSPTIAADTFERTVASGWGAADTGGAWTVSGGTTSVAGGSGVITTGAGVTSTLRLTTTSASDTDITHKAWVEAVPTGGGVYWSDIARRVSSGDYRGKVRVTATGTVQVQLTKLVGSTETALTTAATVPGLTVAANTPLQVRFQATGSNPTTLRIKVWAAGAAEPSAWNQTVTDAETALQGPGAIGVIAYTSGSSTAPVVSHIDGLVAVRP